MRARERNVMRVLLLTAGDSWSGVHVHTISLARALVESGHDVAIVELGRGLYGNAPRLLSCPLIHLHLGAAGPWGTGSCARKR